MDVPASSRRAWVVVLIVFTVAAAVAAVYAWHSRSEKPTIWATDLDLRDGRPKLLEFGIGLCVQCKRMKPVMERAANELEGCLDVRSLDIRDEANELIADRFGMRSMPFVLLVDGTGRELWRHEGFVDYPDMLSAIDERLKDRCGDCFRRSGTCSP